MKSYRQRSINDRLESARVAIKNAGKATLQLKLAPAGYPPAKLAIGQTRYNAAAAAVSESTAKLGEQKLGTQLVEKLTGEVSTQYQSFAKVAHALYLGDAGTLTLLGLDTEMPKARADLKVAAFTLFNTSNYSDAMRAAFAEHGWTDVKLSEARGTICVLELALDDQATCKSLWQEAKETERTTLAAMDKWMACFIKIAREAFAANKQALEQLRVVARSRPTKAQREGRRKAAATRKLKKAAREAKPELKVAA